MASQLSYICEILINFLLRERTKENTVSYYISFTLHIILYWYRVHSLLFTLSHFVFTLHKTIHSSLSSPPSGTLCVPAPPKGAPFSGLPPRGCLLWSGNRRGRLSRAGPFTALLGFPPFYFFQNAQGLFFSFICGVSFFLSSSIHASTTSPGPKPQSPAHTGLYS